MSSEDTTFKLTNRSAERWQSNFRTLVEIFQTECDEAHSLLSLLSKKLSNTSFKKHSSELVISKMKQLNNLVFLLMEFNKCAESFFPEKTNIKSELDSECDIESLSSCLTKDSDIENNQTKDEHIQPPALQDIVQSDHSSPIEPSSIDVTEPAICKEVVQKEIESQIIVETSQDAATENNLVSETIASVSCKSEYSNESKFENQCVVEVKDVPTIIHVVQNPSTVPKIPPQTPLELHKKMQCQVTYVESPSKFYIVLSYSPEFESMTKLFNKFSNKEVQYKRKQDLKNGSYFSCLMNKKCHRVQLLDVLSEKDINVKVFLIDVGSKAKVSYTSLIPLQSDLFAIPPFAYLCHLYKVGFPKNQSKWTKKSLKFMKSKVYIDSSELIAEEVVEGSTGIKLSSNGASINDALITTGLALETDGVKSIVLKTQSANKNESASDKPLPIEVQLRIPPLKTLLSKVRLNCIVTHVETPSLFYVNLVDEDYQSLQERLNTYYQSDDNKFTKSSECTQLYYACLHDGSWVRVRAVRTSQEPAEDIDVYFLDHGLEIRVPVLNLRPLALAFCDTPPRAYRCHLYWIRPFDDTNEWTSTAINFMRKKSLGKNCIITVEDIVENSYGVILFVNSKAINIQMVVKDLARDIEEPNAANSTSVDRSETKDNLPTIANNLSTESNNISVGSSSIKNKSITTHGADTSDKSNVSKFSSTFIRHTSPSNTVSSNLKLAVPEKCSNSVPKAPTDSASFTSHVISNKGSTERVVNHPVDDVIPGILEEPMGMEVENVNLCRAAQGFSTNDEGMVCKHYTGPPATTCFKGPSCKKQHVLLNKQGWTVKKLPVIVQPTLQMQLPDVNTIIAIGMTIVTSYRSFYGHILPCENEYENNDILSNDYTGSPKELQMLAQRMNSPKTLRSIVTFDTQDDLPAVGELISAYYPKDGLWYRARAIEVGSHDVEVLYIDFGNKETLPYYHVARLDRAFAEIPEQAIKFVLSNISLPHGSPKAAEATRFLFNAIADKRLIANVVSTEVDDLIINLCDMDGNNIGDMMNLMGLVDKEEYKTMDENSMVTVAATRLHKTVRNNNPSQRAILYGTHLKGLYPG